MASAVSPFARSGFDETRLAGREQTVRPTVIDRRHSHPLAHANDNPGV